MSFIFPKASNITKKVVAIEANERHSLVVEYSSFKSIYSHNINNISIVTLFNFCIYYT